jgi:superfamily II DNA or RNA helicase
MSTQILTLHRGHPSGCDNNSNVPRVRSFARLRPDKQPCDLRRPFPHQLEAWTRLSAYFLNLSEGGGRGLLVIPTAGGKTFTVIAWIMLHVVASGCRVLWLAHSDELLEQAAREFHRAARRARPRDQIRIRIVSARHHRVDQIELDDDIVIASVASLARRPEVLNSLLADPRSMVVVDEAHHAPARSVRSILDVVDSCGSRLLGLTATPTRTRVAERPVLLDYFGNRMLYEADATGLVEGGVLARPVFVRVDSNVPIDQGLTPSDLAVLNESGELPPRCLNSIAKNERRNQAIVDHYLKYRDRYGQTLIFAINTRHAVTLTGRLRAAGVAADFIAHDRPGRINREVLKRFQDPDGGLDVLINVEMLTEGVDLPLVKTVILGRPTASLILLLQMIGRALRGPAVGGTEVAYIVALQHDWGLLPRGHDPVDLLPHVVLPADAGVSPGQTGPVLARPTWDELEAITLRVGTLLPALTTVSSESRVNSWYLLGPPDPTQGAGSAVPIYDHQVAFWQATIDHLGQLPADALANGDAKNLSADLFAKCKPPLPSPQAFDRLLEHFRSGHGRPVAYTPEARMASDPRTLARLIVEEDMGEQDRTRLLEARYTPLARAIFPTMRDFRAAVDNAAYVLQHPDEEHGTEFVNPVFEPLQ